MVAKYPRTRRSLAEILSECDELTKKEVTQYVEGLLGLLGEALDSVDEDESTRYESWPHEVEKGELILDLGERIREILAAHKTDIVMDNAE